MHKRRQKTSKFVSLFLAFVLLAIGGLSAYAYSQPLASVSPTLDIQPAASQAKPKLNWPAYGEAAIGADSFGVLAKHGQQIRRPTASVAKIMTALAVLKKHPLKLGQQGPTLTLTKQDVQYFNDYYAKDGSLVKVKQGEKISEYQALQAMLLPSANNMAETLAVWAYGSVSRYATSANKLAKSYGMSQTQITDASGFSPSTSARLAT